MPVNSIEMKESFDFLCDLRWVVGWRDVVSGADAGVAPFVD